MKMNKKAQGMPSFESLEEFDLDEIGLTANQWMNVLYQINEEAKRLYSKAKKGDESVGDPKAAQQRAIMLNQRAKALLGQLRTAASNLDLKKEEYSTRKISPSDVTRFTPGRGPGSGAGYSAERERGGRGRGRGGPDGREYQDDIQQYYGTTPPIGMTINLDQSSLWAGVEPNPLGIISLDDFARTGGRVLAEDLFAGMPVPRKEVDQKIFNFLRNRGLYRDRSTRFFWDQNSNQSYIITSAGAPKPITYTLEQAVNMSKTGQTYDELYDKLSRGNSFDLFRKFATSLKREISRVTWQMSEDGAPSVLIKNARRFGPKWVRVLNAKIRDLS